MASTPKRAAQDICRICGVDISSRSTVKFNIFNGSQPLYLLIERTLHPDIPIQQGDGLPHAICRRCNTSLVSIEETDKKRAAMQDSMTICCQRGLRKKRLAKTPAEKRAEQASVPSKAPRDTDNVRPHAARQITFPSQVNTDNSKPEMDLQWTTSQFTTTMQMQSPFSMQMQPPFSRLEPVAGPQSLHQGQQPLPGVAHIPPCQQSYVEPPASPLQEHLPPVIHYVEVNPSNRYTFYTI